MKIYLLADNFIEDFIGGAALNDEVLYDEFKKMGVDVEKVKTSSIDETTLFENDAFFIISNFLGLPPQALEILKSGLNYIIYEHDYKFVKNRNPAGYADFIVPPQDKIHIPLYEGAKAIICQSSFHKEIFDKNLGMGDKTVSLGGNLWSDFHLDLMRVLSQRNKKDMTTLIDSPYFVKGNHLATETCLRNAWRYEYITNWKDYTSFLIDLSKNNKFVFMPLTPETLSRTACEAKMMNVEFISNELVGAAREPWFNLNGPDLVDIMVEKKKEIVNIILEYARNNSSA